MNKKIVVVYGNCHTSVIRMYLGACKEFCDCYEIAEIEYIQNIKDPSYFLNNEYIKKCDVFIHQSIQINNRYGKEYSSRHIIKLLKENCKIISIPNLYHMPKFLFPQFSEEPEFKDRLGNTIFFRDKIIDKYYSEGYSFHKIYKLYTDDNCLSEYDFYGNYKIFKEKIKTREQEWDIKIWDYIQTNIKNIQLFYDPNHPTNQTLKYISEEILKLLGINKPTIETSHEIFLDSFEMPILASTRKALDLTFPLKKEFRITGRKVYPCRMDLEKYIKQYISLEWQNKSIAFLLRIKSFLYFMIYKLKSRFPHFKY